MNKLLDKQLVERLNNNGISEFTELEQVCIPKLKSGHDILCVADKGCGKSSTLVFGVIQQLKKPVGDTPRAVIFVPNIDCALEMKNDFQRFGDYTQLRVHTACENEKILDQKDRIYMGADVVIGTPKRMNEIYALYALNLTGVKIFAIDDAEDVLRNTNYTQLIRLAEGPTKTQRVVFASRMSEWIERFADETMTVQQALEFYDEPLEEE